MSVGTKGAAARCADAWVRSLLPPSPPSWSLAPKPLSRRVYDRVRGRLMWSRRRLMWKLIDETISVGTEVEDNRDQLVDLLAVAGEQAASLADIYGALGDIHETLVELTAAVSADEVHEALAALIDIGRALRGPRPR